MGINVLNEGDNIGGLAQIDVAHVWDLESYEPIRFKPGMCWLEIEFHPMSGLMKEDVQDSDHGVYYSYAGSFKIPKSDRKTECALDRFIGQVSIFRVMDLNGKTLVIGGPDMPVLFTRSSDTGSSPVDMNHASYSFIVSQPNRALYG